MSQVKSLSPKEFENYVGELVRTLDFAKTGTVYLNRFCRGIRQPGTYEIDVSLEVQLADALKFLLIVECKNWKMPVDRPVVQKLAQTRDAISADKAAVVSPVGFTKGAHEVAHSLEIALWVITLQEWIVEYDNGVTGISKTAFSDDKKRNWETNPANTRLVSWDATVSWWTRLFNYPQILDFPEHLGWARFWVSYCSKVDDGRFELITGIQTKLGLLTVGQLGFSARRVLGVGGFDSFFPSTEAE